MEKRASVVSNWAIITIYLYACDDNLFVYRVLLVYFKDQNNLLVWEFYSVDWRAFILRVDVF